MFFYYLNIILSLNMFEGYPLSHLQGFRPSLYVYKTKFADNGNDFGDVQQ